ncbi:s-adenosyl-l-methionine-dependent methyltransferase [Desulfoluna butyratoxydans]|uniref:S-adenosyl-l-methionine-dependent methyltransferase n=1 Tax=Desulfoluna butyratoxydans TaxID=231438 RepID=A0A4U8YMM0_9BACT|nr:s-adenosyl-l-methionine-dependent methyltransferase [Desulfoluna butyratoxydans]
MDTDSYIRSLLVANPLRESILRSVIEAIQLPAGSSGLDAGCGIGLQCLLLAEAVGFSGHVTGLDQASGLLNCGEELVKEAGLSQRISFQKGDVTTLPFDNHTFDWAWSADCIGYAPLEPLPLLKELSRVVKPGGIVAISGWSSENLLPGYPRLEARLRAISGGLAPFIHGKKPETHFLRALGWFRDIGLKEPRVKTFADGFYAPLSYEIRAALTDLIEMRWPDAERELSSDDLSEFQRLCLPDSPDFILNLSDYYAFFTHTLFWGYVAG